MGVETTYCGAHSWYPPPIPCWYFSYQLPITISSPLSAPNMLWGSWLISSHADISAISCLLVSAYLCHSPKHVVGLLADIFPCWYIRYQLPIIISLPLSCPQGCCGAPMLICQYQLSITISLPLSCPQTCCGAPGWYPLLIPPLAALCSLIAGYLCFLRKPEWWNYSFVFELTDNKKIIYIYFFKKIRLPSLPMVLFWVSCSGSLKYCKIKSKQ